MTRAEILDCLTDRPCDSCKFHESGRCERWDCVFEEKPDDCEDTDNYEYEIADLQNLLDIAEYDKDRFKEKVTVLEEKLKALSAKPCEDCISRQAVIDALCNDCELYKNGERKCFSRCEEYHFLVTLPFVTPKVAGCEDCISRQSARKIILDEFEGWPTDEEVAQLKRLTKQIDDLPSVTPKQRTGHWIKVDDEEPIAYDCSECVAMVGRRCRFCPDCGAKMGESEE